MSKHFDAPELRFVLTAVAGWFISALILSLIVSLCLSLMTVGEGAVGCIISALSFVSAVYAGAAAMHRRRRGALLTGLVTGLVITTLALTLGFIIAGSEMEADGILSVVTFTLSGCLVGSVFFSGTGKRGRSSSAKRRKNKP